MVTDNSNASAPGRPHPSFEEVLSHRRRRRRIRPAALTALAVVTITVALSASLILRRSETDPIALSVPTTTAWLAESPGSHWLRDTPKFVLDNSWNDYRSLK